jgi:hypothetical protein
MGRGLEAIQIFCWWMAGVSLSLLVHGFLQSLSLSAAFILPFVAALIATITQWVNPDMKVWCWIVSSAIGLGVVLWIIP